MEITTGQKAPVSGVYAYVRHINRVGCNPTPSEIEVGRPPVLTAHRPAR